MERRSEVAHVPAHRDERPRPTAPAAPSSHPMGPLARRVGRIGANVILKQMVKALLSAVLRR